MTGRAAGYCAGYGMPGYANPIAGRGFGMGFGRGGRRGGGGRGWRNGFYATGLPGWMRFGMYPGAMVPPAMGMSAPGPWAPYAQPDSQAEKQMLNSQAQALQAQLDAIKKRLDEIETAPAEE